MSSIRNNIHVSPQDVFVTSTTQGTDLGAYATTGDGRIFRYAKAGGTALVAGTLLQSQAEDTTNLENLTVVAASAGAKSVTISVSTTLSANSLAGGYLATTTGAGFGYMYKIASNGASTLGTSLAITLEDPIITALSASTTKVDLYPSPYNGVIINPTTATSAPVGVAITTLASSSFGWIQTHGPAVVQASSALLVGQAVCPSTATAGNVVAASTIGAVNLVSPIGFAITGVAAVESGLVFLEID